MAKNKNYSKLVGLKKTLKNAGVMFGIPALLYVIENWVDFIPDEYHAFAGVVAGSLAYFVKNWQQNK